MTDYSRQTVASAHQRIESHERECAVRYTGIQSAIADLKGDLRWILRGTFAVVLTIAGWLALQVYNGIHTPVQAQPAPVAEPAASNWPGTNS